MNEPILILAGGIFFAVLLGFLATRLLFERAGARMERRLNGHASDEGSVEVLPQPRHDPDTWTGRMDQGFEDLVLSTGLDMGPEQALGWIALVGVVVGGAAYLFKPVWWMGALGLVLGSGVMLAALFVYRARYRRQLQEQLPDALYLMARSLRAGLSLEQCLALVADQGLKPMATEFGRVSAQVRLGLSIPAALENAARRIQLLDFNALVSTVALYQTTGGNLPLLLDRLAASARDRNQFASYFRSATALGRTTATALALAAPAILLGYLIFEPEFSTSFFQTSRGWTTIALAAALEIIGLVWLYKLLQINY
jgi:tight adherence protein B